MRAPSEARPTAWPLRLLRPWLVASAFGLLIGLALLRFEERDAEESLVPYYSEAAPRPAMAEAASGVGAADFAVGVTVGSLGESMLGGAETFSPAAPISASAELSGGDGASFADR